MFSGSVDVLPSREIVEPTKAEKLFSEITADGGKLLIGTQNSKKAQATINNYIYKVKANKIG